VSQPHLSAILCADWSKSMGRREVYAADVETRQIRRLEGTWTGAAVVEAARELAGDGSALATFDAPLGVPSSYWQKLRRVPGFPARVAVFPAWLPEALKRPRYFENARAPFDWRVEQPFFAIAPGAGGRRVWEDRLKRAGVATLRRVDELTRAKPVFVTAGIPGTAGSGARELWKDLGRLLAAPPGPGGAGFVMWPFDGPLDELLARKTVVVGETYPRLAYALALSREDPAARAPLQIAKTRRDLRQAALADLRAHPWLQEHAVRLHDTDAAASSEDAFDALFGAAGLLRSALEGTLSASGDLADPVAEGGILGSGSLDLTHREATYAAPSEAPPPRRRRSPRHRDPGPDMRPRLAGAPRPPLPPPEPVYPCPIPRCDHVFTGSRAGWDVHVASLRMHPRWQPDVRDPAERKALFRSTYPRFFR
jgi:hypothetical protein